MTKLPPWIARSDADRRAMFHWVNERLDDMLEAGLHWSSEELDEFERSMAPIWNTPPEILAAERGDLGPLIAKYPFIPRFFKPRPHPKRPRGRPKLETQERSRRDRPFRIEAAADDVKRIRRLWLDEYGKQNRGKNKPSAVDIAAERWEDDPSKRAEFAEDVNARLKHKSSPQ